MLAWRSSDYIEYVVVLPLENVGSGWAEPSPFDSDYTILDPDGGITATGSFTYAYPGAIAPGETGYLVEESLEEGQRTSDYHSVDVTGSYLELDEPGPSIEVVDIKWRRESRFSYGLTASGFLISDRDFESASVGVFCWANDGSLLAVSTTNLVQNITAGNRKAFETIGETAPLRPEDCKRSEGFVSGFDY